MHNDMIDFSILKLFEIQTRCRKKKAQFILDI